MATRAEIENMNFGVAAEMGPYGQQQGALRDILRITSGSSANADRAIALANQLMPPPEEADPYEAMFRYFSGMAKAASQPGATVLSSALAPMDVPLDYYTAKKKELKQSEQARMQAALSLGPSLKAPVVKATYGKPDFYMVSRLVDGKLTEAVETPLTPKQFDDLQPQIKDGSVVITAVPKAGTSGAQSPLGKLIADYDGGAGSMTKAQFDAQYTKLTNVADGSETALEKLEAQAIAGGLEKGTDAYKEWILTGGKPSSGFSLESDGKGGFTFVQGDVAGQRSGRVDKGYIQKTMTDGTVVQQVVPGSLAFTEVETQRSGFVGDIAQANFLLETVDAIIGRPEGGGQTGMPPNPNLDAVLGSVQGKIPMNMFFDQGKTDVLVDIDYIKSNAFMQAFESLKGGGQITEKEGEAATAALAKLSRLQDPEKFKAGLQDFVNIIRIGMANNRNLIDELPKYADTITGGEGVELDFNSMDRQRLGLIDIDSLTYLQKQLMAIRLGEL
jgi:hypothetical protein